MITNGEIERAANDFESMADAARHCGLAFGTFRYRAKKLGVYKPNQSGKGRTLPNKGQPYDLQKILNGDIQYKASSAALKRKLLDENLKQDVCEICGQLPEWNGKILTLQLDHIDGDHNNNNLNNLRILCPNCHTQTPTFGRGKGVKKHKHLNELSIECIEIEAQNHSTVTELATALGLNKNSSSVRSLLKKVLGRAQVR